MSTTIKKKEFPSAGRKKGSVNKLPRWMVEEYDIDNKLKKRTMFNSQKAIGEHYGISKDCVNRIYLKKVKYYSHKIYEWKLRTIKRHPNGDWRREVSVKC